ncbi:hypothetical protein ACQKEN_19020, partial [Pseudomonas sp. NPDC078416]|uniref:hypothetical protein n=1 Tax=Pseudomonas sp. NPDC078416 TaxID=3390637 RepID=UPI003D000412
RLIRVRQIAFAGKRAPAVDLGMPEIFWRTQNPQEPACWRRRRVRRLIRDRQTAFASKLTPTVDLGKPQILWRTQNP